MKDLFQVRMRTSWLRGISRTASLMRGGGTPIFLGILLFSLYFLYQKFTQWLPTPAPLLFPLTVLLALLLMWTQVRTWIQPADLIFLLPYEAKMREYFRASIWYSYMISLIKWGIVVALLYPLYLVHIGRGLEYLGFTCLLLLLQLANLFLSWSRSKQQMNSPSWQLYLSQGGRFLLNFTVILFFLQERWMIWALFLILYLVWIAYIYLQTRTLPYAWYQLLEQEQIRRNAYLTLASWFIDVSEKHTTIKHRRWIIHWIERLFPEQPAFTYLYIRSFLRTEDQWPFFPRIQIWVLVIVVGFPYPWLASGLLIFSLWLMAEQLTTLSARRRYPLWVELYPLKRAESTQGLSRIAIVLLTLQSLILTLLYITLEVLTLSASILLFSSAVLVSYLLSYLHLPRQQKSSSTQ